MFCLQEDHLKRSVELQFNNHDEAQMPSALEGACAALAEKQQQVTAAG